MTDHLDLVQTYEPVLLFSKDGDGNPENFFPMAAGDFVQSCDLRRKGDGSKPGKWLYHSGETRLEHLDKVEKSDQCYLVYALEDAFREDEHMLQLFDILEGGGMNTESIDKVTDVLEKYASAWDGMERKPWDPNVLKERLAGINPILATRTHLLKSASDMKIGTAEQEDVYQKGLSYMSYSALEEAKRKYDSWQKYPPVYHYHVCEYEDKHCRYRAIEYWFLYAFNDWSGHGGVNNHEGDWEMVCVLLDFEKNEPRWVAYSQHVNHREERWTDLREVHSVAEALKDGKPTRVETHPVVYVGCGSHANYRERDKDTYLLLYHDYHHGNDDRISIGPEGFTKQQWGKPVRLNRPWATEFKGEWGAPLGTGGPTGPACKGEKWAHPAEWAKIEDQFRRN